jgi:hypothetical protein
MEQEKHITRKNGEPLQPGEQGSVDAGHRSTTQGGENFGQGSSQLGNDKIKQGSEGTPASDEKGLNEEAIPGNDMPLE